MSDNNENNKAIRARFAPSPTGFLHIGTARATLFNWLFTRHYNGTFILRIEDTDKERSLKEYEEDLIKGLKWLGMNWDEGPDVGGQYGPYRQSERAHIYKKYIEKLLEESKAYYCFCTKEELEAEHSEQEQKGLPLKYSGRCRDIDPVEAKKRVENGESATIRIKIPETELKFNDLIHGEVKFQTSLFGDLIIAKDINNALFALSNAIDDYEMKITHVIRGEDHLSNTPKQVIIQTLLGFNTPEYGHLPLILDSDRKKLSKRKNKVSLNEYKDEGYLPEAMLNFLVLMGWHPTVDREIISRNEMIEEFDFSRVQKAGAVFDVNKLNWLNEQYIKETETGKLKELLSDFIPEEWKKGEYQELLEKIISIEKARLKKLTDFKESASFFFEAPEYEADLLIWKNMTKEDIKNNLLLVASELDKLQKDDFTKESLENKLMPLAEKIGKGELLWPLRVALSGRKNSPGPFEIMSVLDKQEILNRINSAISKL